MRIPEDPFIIELLPEFVDTWLNDIDEQYDKYLEEHNADDLYRLAHTLKGSCFQFGLDEIAEMGIKLMSYCKVNNWTEARAIKPSIVSAFQQAQDYIKNNNL